MSLWHGTVSWPRAKGNPWLHVTYIAHKEMQVNYILSTEVFVGCPSNTGPSAVLLNLEFPSVVRRLDVTYNRLKRLEAFSEVEASDKTCV
jgi:hypothetical protein